MSCLTKLAFMALILPWLCQCMVQNIPYLLSGNETFYTYGHFPILQLGDSQLFAINHTTFATYNLTGGQISTFTNDISCSDFDIISENIVYCVNSDYHVLQVDPSNSMGLIADYGAPNLTGSFLTYAYNDNGIIFNDFGEYEIFNTSTNQFTCQFTIQQYISPSQILPYEGGYVVTDPTTKILQYQSCDGTVFSSGDKAEAQLILNSSSIVIAMPNDTAFIAISFSQNKTGPALLIGDFLDILKVNDTHFIATSNTSQSPVTTFALYTTNSDLEIIQCASLDVPNLGDTSSYYYPSFFNGNNSVTITYDYTLFWIDLESFAISQVLAIESTPYPQMLLSNGSFLGFTQDGYYIFSEGTFVTFGTYMNCYIDPSNADFVWMLLDSSVLMIQVSKSMSRTFSLDVQYRDCVLVSASYDGADEYNFTISGSINSQLGTSVVVILSGVMQGLISISSHYGIIATNYQNGTLHYLSCGSSSISELVYDFYNGYKISEKTIISSYLVNATKINDNYAIIANTTTSTEIFIYSFNQSQFIYSQNLTIQMVNQIAPLGLNLTSYCIAQGFAILSVNGQTYTAFDTQGNQLGDSITFPSSYNVQLQAINNISVSLMVKTSYSSPLNYMSVYQYTGTAPEPNPPNPNPNPNPPNPPNPNPNASLRTRLSHLLLGVFIIVSLMI